VVCPEIGLCLCGVSGNRSMFMWCVQKSVYVYVVCPEIGLCLCGVSGNRFMFTDICI